MESSDKTPMDPFEARLRRALHRGVPPDDSLAERILERIDGRSPREMLQDRLVRFVRRGSAAAAVLLAVLVIVAVSLGRRSADGSAEEGWASGESEIPSILHTEAYLEEYSNEAEVLAAVFTVEMAR